MNSKARTDYLFARSSFLTGMGSCVALAGNYFFYNASSSGEAADKRAIQSDWEVIGEDLWSVMRAVPPEQLNSVSLAPLQRR